MCGHLATLRSKGLMRFKEITGECGLKFSPLHQHQVQEYPQECQVMYTMMELYVQNARCSNAILLTLHRLLLTGNVHMGFFLTK